MMKLKAIVAVIITLTSGAMAREARAVETLRPTGTLNFHAYKRGSAGLATWQRLAQQQQQFATQKSTNAASGAPTNLSFFSTPQIKSGGYPTIAVAGDFNGDGKRDLAAVIFDKNSVSHISFLGGNGDGTFQAAQLSAVNFSGQDRMYAADLNNDGKDDLVVVHSNSVEVLLSNGNGTFAAAVSRSETIAAVAAVVVKDVNSDGIADVVIADQYSGMVSTLLGNGNGTLQAETQVSYPGQVAQGIFADVDGDGKLDLISTTNVYINNGSGYTAGSSLLSSNGQMNFCSWIDGVVAVGDVNGDGYPDIVTADCGQNTITVYLNNGDGTYPAGNSQWAGPYPVGVSLADLNGDGHLDIISADDMSNDVSVLLGNGNGTFQGPQTGYSFGSYFWWTPVVADFNGDGVPDVVCAEYNPGVATTLAFLKGAGDGSFVATRDYYWQQLDTSVDDSTYSVGMASGDFNNDGITDFVQGNAGGTTLGVTVFLANGDGTLQPGVSYGTGGNLSFVAVGDFNGDGNQDIAASDTSSGNVVLLLGNGDGTFQAGQTFAADSSSAWGIVAGDFNSDGKLDVAVAGAAGVSVLLNNGSGGFQSPSTYATSSAGYEIATADLDGDGVLDLAMTQNQSQYVSLLRGAGDGTFQTPQDLNLISNTPMGIAIGDLNGDGKKDLAVTVDDSSGNMGVVVALGNGNGTFKTPVRYASSAQGFSLPAEIKIADMNLDGRADLVCANTGAGSVGVLFGKGDGSYFPAVEYPTNPTPFGLALADIDGDGFADVVAGSSSFSGVTVSLNTAGTQTTLISSVNPAAYGASVTFTATVTKVSGMATGTPGGTVTFSDGATVLGNGTIASGQASFSTSALGPGSHSITATYAGDAAFLTSTSTALTQVINAPLQVATTTSLVSSLNPSSTGTSVTFTATVAASASSQATPSGTVTFSDGANVLGTGTIASGTATFSISTLAAGSHSITASYGGDVWFLSSTSAPLSQVVNAVMATQTALSSSLNPSTSGFPITFTATVTPSSSTQLVPSGTVTFYDTGVSIGSAALSGGQAEITVSDLLAGSHDITASYAGDSSFSASDSAVLTQEVDHKANNPQDFRFTVSAPTMALAAGQSGKISMLVTPINGFTGTVSFACGQLPAGVSCSMAPTSVTINGTLFKSSTLTVSVADNFTASQNPAHSSGAPLLWSMGSLAFGCVGLLGVRRNKSRLAGAILGLVLLALILSTVGCGGVSSVPGSGNGNGSATTTSEVIQVTASAPAPDGNSSPTTHVLNLTILVAH